MSEEREVYFAGRMVAVPSKAILLAVDPNGDVYSYDAEPVIDEQSELWNTSYAHYLLCNIGPRPDWRESLTDIDDCLDYDPVKWPGREIKYSPGSVTVKIGGKEIKGFHDCYKAYEESDEELRKKVIDRLTDFKVDARIVQHGNPTRGTSFKEQFDRINEKAAKAFADRFINGTSDFEPKGLFPELSSEPELITMDDMERETDKAVKQYLDDNVPPPLHHDMAKQIKSSQVFSRV